MAKNGKQYIAEALKNSKQFLEDAKVLIDNESFAHGAALAVLAIEEAVKAKIATNYIGRDSTFAVDSTTYEEEIKSHFNKLAQAAKDHVINAAIYRLMPEGRASSCSLEELYERAKKLAKDKDEVELLEKAEVESYLYACMTVLKMKWLYVDVEEGQIASPLTWSKDDALEVLRMAKKRFSEYEMDITVSEIPVYDDSIEQKPRVR